MYAKYNKVGNRTVYDLLDKMSNDDREKDRGSYYGSLSGIFRHIIGGTQYFLGIYKNRLVTTPMWQEICLPLKTFPNYPKGR